MNIIARVFRRSSTKPGKQSPKNEGSAALTCVDDSLSSGETPKKERRKSKGKKKGKTVEPATNKTNHLEIIEEFMLIMKRHDHDALLAAFETPSSKVHLEDNFSTDAKTFSSTLKTMWDAFPDHAFHYDSVYAQGETVVIDGLVSSATHTGAPYTIGEAYPPIPATGKHVINDEERFVFTFTPDGKVESMAVISFGNVTGPAGFYEQIGGELDR